MKAPKCRLCHKEHYGLCGHVAKSPSTNAAPADTSSKVSPARSSVKSVSSRGSAKPLIARTAEAPDVQHVDISTSDGQITNKCGALQPKGGSPTAPTIGGAIGEDAPHHTGSPVNGCREQDRKSPTDLSEGNEGSGNPQGLPDNQSSPDGVRPLTPAEKQKAYRKRLKDDPVAYEAYREANKLRMREKRMK